MSSPVDLVRTRDYRSRVAYCEKSARYLCYGMQSLSIRIFHTTRCASNNPTESIEAIHIGTPSTNGHPAQCRSDRIILIRGIAGHRIKVGCKSRRCGLIDPTLPIGTGKDRAACAYGGKYTGGSDR